MNERIYQLQEFTGDRAFEIVGELLEPIGEICANEANRKAKDENGSVLHFAAAIVKNSAAELRKIFTALSRTPGEYNHNAACVMIDALYLFSDPEIQKLFGLRAQTGDANSSAPVTENTAE